MRIQDYRHHRRIDFLYHVLTIPAIIALLIGSIVNLVHANRDGLYSASLLVLVSLILVSLYIHARSFPLRAQDRAIRAEESLRHFILAGKPLDKDLTLQQIIALRFAGDEEFVRLARRAAEEGLSNDEIKNQIKHWRADHHRV